MTSSGQDENTVDVGWDGVIESVSGKTGVPLNIVIRCTKITQRVAEDQAATLKLAAVSGTPFCEP